MCKVCPLFLFFFFYLPYLKPSSPITSPSLKRKTEGPYCPPQPQPQPLPCSNARCWGSIAHHNHIPSLTRTQDGRAFLPTPHHCLTPPLPRSKLKGFVHHHHLSIAQTLLEHETGGPISSPTTSLLVTTPSVTQNTSGGGFYLHYLVTLLQIHVIIC